MKPITSGQKEQCVTVIKDAARKGAEEAIQDLEKSGVINGDNIQKLLECGNQLKAVVVEAVKRKLNEIAENISGCLKLISGAETITLEPTDGKETIAKAADLFTGWLDSNFNNWGCDVKSKPTAKMNVDVHEMIKDGDFAKIFGGLSDDLDKLCMTQSQVIQFVKNHRKWLRTDGWATFFLFKVGNEFFVADVFFDDRDQLKVLVYRFSRDFVWNAEYRLRVVVPQLTP